MGPVRRLCYICGSVFAVSAIWHPIPCHQCDIATLNALLGLGSSLIANDEKKKH